ncbi:MULTISPECIES: assimilatory sulfite reductase (NADPH) hemoprotein subunit [Bacillus]|uniref:Sulfite reductase [NADPH] hemoprotein beta-component n=1 Tax=Bacillus amyloliquefaciens (strain ATCC 23350 / DSM 7 / BCRC 11601 / CCUG 28519 / NBRC 15535 / NRRL B-14393 / F) TaxID=692420 RepID=A0A9P1NIR2_BACAS|nr:assimilatory sulfite reductase (NADPH) hemoprotein subunit [Bacillus amyloliquefaciens]ARW40541.1 Assimilatory sulfite reductase (NADPH) [Bacillus amyloliquefaciens]AZV90683.1 sulfite reductase [Bacillus amyloliquefaciens]KYC99260.1 Sulfite reductase [Bacillus amyloliquefaciens]MBW8279053.1 assimilatory sulfite reductase (NADPH) hemoprotein subunit [Bacillus amyloliquefaciens]MDR4376405.1 assimilatory sulfite reductase (NADPH) hemoprotein subunit [Bacillus amyloliquefaciens]
MVNNILKAPEGPPSDVEEIKEKSDYLRGTLKEVMLDRISAGIPDDDNRLMKHHGSYLQDDRDLRNERQKQKLEPAYQFMLRVRMPGGVSTPEQWLVMDELAQKYGNNTLKLTTRETFQMHGILKWNMKKTIQKINEALLDTIAACGDVNRNVMCASNPYQSEIHAEVYEWSKKLSDDLLPRTRAYHEIWLDEERVAGTPDTETEPMYGPLYLPRKFKIGIAVPPSNDIDVFSQDLGFIAIVEEGRLIGFNVAIGGGMGMTHGDTATYPQLSKVIGFCKPEQLYDVAEKTITIQRDYGNRSVRKNARFKYTVDRLGLENVKAELENRLGWQLDEAKPYHFDHNGDRYGWVKGVKGTWHFTMFIEGGRVTDYEDYKLMTGLREIAKVHTGDFRLTSNQNLIIGNVTSEKKKQISALIEQYGLTDGRQHSALRRSSMACVALPTCGLAMAEAERYLPKLIDKIEAIVDENGLRDEEITIRMTGCPNGCARHALGEIGFIGKAPGKYNMYLGAAFDGSRLSKMYRENIGEEEILSELRTILPRYAKEREEGEHFGDFVIRAGIIKATTDGTNFHE